MNLEDFSDFLLRYNFIKLQMYSFHLIRGLMNSLPINDTKDFPVAWDSTAILITMNNEQDTRSQIPGVSERWIDFTKYRSAKSSRAALWRKVGLFALIREKEKFETQNTIKTLPEEEYAAL